MKEKLCTSEAMPKRSLLNSLSNLETKAVNLVGLAAFSDQVVGKFNNPRQLVEIIDESVAKNNCIDEIPVPDLIDLFNNVADILSEATARIEDNTYQINSIFE